MSTRGNFDGPRRASAKLLDIDLAELKLQCIAKMTFLGNHGMQKGSCSRCNRPKSMPPRVAICPAAFSLLYIITSLAEIGKYLLKESHLRFSG